jgi:hypothetical protein
MQRMPSIPPQAPCGTTVIPATSRSAGPIQQMPGSMRNPAMASNTGTTERTARSKRFIRTSIERRSPGNEQPFESICGHTEREGQKNDDLKVRSLRSHSTPVRKTPSIRGRSRRIPLLAVMFSDPKSPAPVFARCREEPVDSNVSRLPNGTLSEYTFNHWTATSRPS